MTFGQQLLSTLIGTISGFLFSIALFYLTQKIKHWNEKNNILKSLKREFRYNLSLLNNLLNDINKTITKISADDKDVFFYFRYANFQRLFLQEAFRLGLLYDKLKDDDINNIDGILTHFSASYESYINQKIDEWKNDGINKKDMLKIFEFERDTLEKYIKQLEQIKAKV